MEFKLTSPAFGHGMQIPSKYTCDGENINPHLVIHGVPEKAKSLALVMDDPDAPGGLWIHWNAWNIPPDTREIREHTVPFGTVEGLNSWGESSWRLPRRHHRYFFRCMRWTRNAPAGRYAKEAGYGDGGHIVATTELMEIWTNEAPL
jgi:Raf kinase inhibitor-like YbhB/YbcL family protein